MLLTSFSPEPPLSQYGDRRWDAQLISPADAACNAEKPCLLTALQDLSWPHVVAGPYRPWCSEVGSLKFPLYYVCVGCVCVCTHLCRCVHMYTDVISHVFLFVWDRVSYWFGDGQAGKTSWPASSGIQPSLASIPSSTEFMVTMLDLFFIFYFKYGIWGLNSGPHIFEVGILLTGLSLPSLRSGCSSCGEGMNRHLATILHSPIAWPWMKLPQFLLSEL